MGDNENVEIRTSSSHGSKLQPHVREGYCLCMRDILQLQLEPTTYTAASVFDGNDIAE